jgi:cyanate permease
LEKKDLNLQWIQLFVLSLVHFQADMFGSLLPPILPVIRERFDLNLTMATGLLFVFYFVHNGIQVIIGHTRVDKEKPLLLQLGLMLSALVCLLALFRDLPFVYPLLLLLVIVSGSGVGMAHNEGLRSLHKIDRITPSFSTSIFMTGGYLGAAVGQFLATLLVDKFGLSGLLYLIPLPVVVVALVIAAKIRLAVEDDSENITKPKEQYKFRLVAIMAIPASIATFILFWFIPTRLNQLGFSLTFGGFSSMIFTLAGAAGSFFTAAFSYKIKQLHCAIIALLIAIPATFCYLLIMSSERAVIFLAVIGFCATSAYVLLVTMARSATGLKIGQRLGILVGGTWAVAGVFVLAGVEFIDLKNLLYFSPFGFLISACFGFYIFKTSRQEALSQAQRRR